MTPDKLREKGNRWWELGQYDLANIYNQHAAALEEIERLNGALSKIADYIEPHWKGAGLDLNGAWLLEEIAKRGDALEQAERRAELLKVHAEAMAEHMVKAIVVVGWPEEQSYGDEWSHDADRIIAAYRAEKGE